MQDQNIIMAEQIAAAVQQAGGRAYYVGGFVRDRLLGVENKDVDLEVHGVTPQQLETILDGFGERQTVGKSFGVMGLHHYGLDISMPRAETSTGRGHKDFYAFVDPFLGEQKAALRRDFTMNALMQDVLTHEILDFFGGRADLANGVIRHVNDNTYQEDPLRVFRAAQFAARFGFAVAKETTDLSSRIPLDGLPDERVLGELQKALLKAKRPSVFFEELRNMRQLAVWFPEAAALIGVPQNPAFHPEGDVWAHTMQVLDESAALRAQSKRPFRFMLAALCHDFGKPVTTQEVDGVLHAYGHEIKGLPPVESFLARLTNERELIRYVLRMTELHMQPNRNADAGAGVKSFMRLFGKTDWPEDLLLLAKADYLGRFRTDAQREALLRDYESTEQTLHKMLSVYRERMSRPYVMGRDLLRLGVQPGPALGEVLAYVHKLRLAGVPKEEQLKHALALARHIEKSRDAADHK